jgi:hypothetical protein
MPDLAILYEHPKWFEPLFAALDRRGIAFQPIRLSDHSFDPASTELPAPVILSRVAMSSFLREADHGIFYAEALLAHWAGRGARVLNGADVLAIDTSKARQLSLITGLGLAIPEPAPSIARRPRSPPRTSLPRAGQGQYRRLGRGYRPLFERGRTRDVGA